MGTKKTVIYFGLFDPSFSRNKIYADGLRQNGIEVILCTDSSRGLLKYWRLFKKHRAIKDSYDAMIVGFPGYIVVPFARLIAKRGKPVIYDALCSFYETQIISRNAYRGNPFRIPYVRIVDWLSTRSADFILVESEEQKDYFVESLGVRRDKCIVTYTGVDKIFDVEPAANRYERFTVLFRGRITTEAGAEYVLRAAKILEDKGIHFLIIGFGWGSAVEEFSSTMESLKPKNVEHIKEQVPLGELIYMMRRCHVSLGQFGKSQRLERTIPHKAYESLAMRLPYITARTAGISEILEDGRDCLMVNPADPEDLARKILELKEGLSLRESLAQNGYNVYRERFVAEKIVGPILELIKDK